MERNWKHGRDKNGTERMKTGTKRKKNETKIERK